MSYAPVIIPTLNRYAHLKKCLDSLSNNTLAEDTEIFISVDYPPAPKYENGYRKVVDMLNDYDFSCFKNADVTYQTSNLGAKRNTEYLFSKAKTVSQTAIYSEDDNEFAPNFLEYINKSLNKFNDDREVIFVCGTIDTHWIFPTGANVTKTKFCPSYGTGVWLNRREKFISDGSQYLLDKKNWSFFNFRLLYKRNRFLFSKYICDILLSEGGLYWQNDGTLNFCDVPKAIYMHLSEYTSISPAIPVSRTFGNDGSGTNMPVLDTIEQFSLDESTHFEIVCSGNFKYDPKNYAIGEEFLCRQYLQGKRWNPGMFLALFGALLLLLTGKNRNVTIKIIHIISRIFKKK